MRAVYGPKRAAVFASSDDVTANNFGKETVFAINDTDAFTEHAFTIAAP
jgi:hypothetical protein